MVCLILPCWFSPCSHTPLTLKLQHFILHQKAEKNRCRQMLKCSWRGFWSILFYWRNKTFESCIFLVLSLRSMRGRTEFYVCVNRERVSQRRGVHTNTLIWCKIKSLCFCSDALLRTETRLIFTSNHVTMTKNDNKILKWISLCVSGVGLAWI